MELLDLLKIAGGAGGGMLGTVIIYLKVLVTRLDKIEKKVDKINGSIVDHTIRLAALEKQ